MKISGSFFSKICFITGFILLSQYMFATDIIIRKDDQSVPPKPVPLSLEIIPVSATIDETQLAVYFDWAVGNVLISVYDSTDNLVYQETVNTYSNLDVFVEADTWTSGSYTLKISYGTTNLIGEFQTE